jgi:hypothetical protein
MTIVGAEQVRPLPRRSATRPTTPGPFGHGDTKVGGIAWGDPGLGHDSHTS